MGRTSPTSAGSASSAVRPGRPPRERAGEVEQRILDAARDVFVRRGFEGASVDEIADVARAGKPTIYARFPGKEALFAAVVAHQVADNTQFDDYIPTGATIEERLQDIGLALLRRVLMPDTIGLIRSTIAEARRFPDLASSVSRMARERGSESVARLLGDVAQTGELRALPAFAPQRLATTARFFLDLVVLPLLLRGLFGENPDSLCGEIAPHVGRTVAFFLAGCRHGAVD